MPDAQNGLIFPANRYLCLQCRLVRITINSLNESLLCNLDSE